MKNNFNKLIRDSIKLVGFCTTITLLSFLVYIYPIYAIHHLIKGGNLLTISAFLQSVFIASLLTYYFRTSSVFYPLRLIAYEGLGIGFLAFWIMSFGLFFDFFFQMDSKLTGYICLGLIFLSALLSYISTLFFITKEICLLSDKVDKDYYLVFLSDVHLGSNNKNHLKRLINKIEETKPEAVLIGGDLIDSTSFNFEGLSLFESLKIPIYFVTGNHEYYLKNSTEKLASLKNYQVIMLDNISTLFKGLNIIGVSDNVSIKNKVSYVKELAQKSLFNICLVHKPSIWKQISTDIDIMLSGHTHKGQLFPFNFFVKLQFKYIYGTYKDHNSTLYVSSGAGTWGPRMRFGSFNEIIKLTIQKVK